MPDEIADENWSYHEQAYLILYHLNQQQLEL
jgi:hypothetical protein